MAYCESDSVSPTCDISAEDQFPFTKSRRGADIINRDPEDHFGLEDDDKETSEDLPRRGRPSRNDLTPSRKAPPPLAADVEASLISATQSGDAAAGHRLLLHHEAWVRAEAFKRWAAVTSYRYGHNAERATSLDDFVAVGCEAFWESVLRWRPGSRLNTFYRRAVRGALADIGHEWRNSPGIQIDSRVQRYIRSHPEAGVLELHQKFPKLRRFEIDFELNASHEIWKPTHYSEIGNVDDDGEYDRDGDYKGGGESVFTGPVTGYVGGPVSEWSRKRASNILHPSRLLDPTDWVQTKTKSGSTFADRVTDDIEHRIDTRFRQMGRRAYSRWLCDRKSTYKPELITPPSLRIDENLPIRNSTPGHVPLLFGPGQAASSYWDVSSPSRKMSSARKPSPCVGIARLVL